MERDRVYFNYYLPDDTKLKITAKIYSGCAARVGCAMEDSYPEEDAEAEIVNILNYATDFDYNDVDLYDIEKAALKHWNERIEEDG